MKTSILSAFLFMLWTFNVHAQEITKQEKGYFNITEVGYFISNNKLKYSFQGTSGEQISASYALSLRNINGVFVTNNLSLGFGLGLENYTVKRNTMNNHNIFAVFADGRYYLKNSRNTFFGFVDLGTSVAIDEDFEKGLMANGGVGYKFMVARRAAMNFSVGYANQRISVFRNPYYDSWGYSSATFKVGLML